MGHVHSKRKWWKLTLKDCLTVVALGQGVIAFIHGVIRLIADLHWK
jgi:hypothetical protein